MSSSLLRTSSNPSSDNNPEALTSRVLLLINTLLVVTILASSLPIALQKVREYSSGVAVICLVSGEINCAKGAFFIAEKVGATPIDALRGAGYILSLSEQQDSKKRRR